MQKNNPGGTPESRRDVGGQGTQMSNTTQGVGSPISNEAYNVISALHAKLEGLEAYRKYAKDGGADEIWKTLTQGDVQAVTKLVDELERIVQTGKLRVGQPGRGNA